MKLLWIGMTNSDKALAEMAQNGYEQTSVLLAQQNIIKGIETNLNQSVDSLNCFRLNPYPKYKKIIIKENRWSHGNGAEDICVGFTNLKYYSHISRTIALKKAAKQWALKHKNEKNPIVLVYAMHSPFMKAASIIKKILKQAKIYLIVPDLPQFMDLNMNFVKRQLKKIDWEIIKNQMVNFDGYILFTKHMAKFLELPEHEWIVMEGSIDENKINNILTERDYNNEKTIIMYSGAVDKKYGILELIDAFTSIKDDNYELWISGSGNAVNQVEERSKLDRRISFFGFLPSREDVLLKQQQATMLINMRLPTEESSAYCFPSKIFEYMASGKPVLSFRLDGIPDDYFDYLVEIKSTSKEDIVNAIKFIGNMKPEERNKFGNRARDFIIKNKNALLQTKKIVKFIEQIEIPRE